MKNTMTVVLMWDDDAELPKQLTKAMMDESEIGGCNVTAVSMEDEIIKVERIEEQANNWVESILGI